MLAEVIEQRHTPYLLETSLPGFQGIDDLLPAAPERRPAKSDEGGARRPWRPRLQRLTQRRQCESLRRPFGEDAESGEVYA